MKREGNIKKKLCPVSQKIVSASEYDYTWVIVLLLIFSRKFITWKLSPEPAFNFLPTSCQLLANQFVMFKPLSFCFEETIGFDVKGSFASCSLSHVIR